MCVYVVSTAVLYCIHLPYLLNLQTYCSHFLEYTCSFETHATKVQFFCYDVNEIHPVFFLSLVYML